MRILILLLLGPLSYSAGADFTWSGGYRIEGQRIFNSELEDKSEQKAYALHHLYLMPKIVASDGITVTGRFDIFNDDDYPESRRGQVFGSGRADDAGLANTDLPDTLGENQKAETLEVTELYLTYAQEFGALVAGRAPIQFGLGITHSAGNGAFDHFHDTRDLVGYKIVMGNFYVMPMYAKLLEGDLGGNLQDISAWMVHAQYESPAAGQEMGIFYEGREGSDQADSNDTTNSIGSNRVDAFEKKWVNIYYKDTEAPFTFGFEASFLDGDSGVKTAGGDRISFGGYGLATEFRYAKPSNAWSYEALLGYASGDDPETEDTFEGFLFDRNYDVGFLLFNFPLGQADFLRTNDILAGNGSTFDVENSPDVEALSNVLYLAPSVHYKWSDKWSLNMKLIAGQLTSNPIAGEDVDKALGFEFDFGFEYRPNERITWVNEVGFLSPGAAFEGGSNEYKTESAYGLRSRAAISF